MELTIKNTANKTITKIVGNFKLYAIEKALFYNNYDMRKCYSNSTITMKERDVHNFRIYLNEFNRSLC